MADKKKAAALLVALALTMGSTAALAEESAAAAVPNSDAVFAQAQGTMPPAPPDGKMGNPPQGAPGGQMPSGTPGMPPGGFNPPTEMTQGTAAHEVTAAAAVKDATYTSEKDDENALRVTGAKVSFKNITVDKKSGATSNTEAGDFWGQNAAFLATDGAQVKIKDSKVSSTADNGNGIFSYGEGTKVEIKNVAIRTKNDHSGGIQTTGGGTTYAFGLDVVTLGNSSAAIRSDRGGGTVRVKKGTYETEGYGSPAIYSTADIRVEDATLKASNSEAAVIEGKNSIALKNCVLEGSMADTRIMGKNTIREENIHNVMIYQSMSGDAEEGKSSFTMEKGRIVSHRGDVIYVTNTQCEIYLKDVKIESLDPEGKLLYVAGNSAVRGWGTAGANGGSARAVLEKEEISGTIVADTVSTLDLTLAKGTVFTGVIDIEENKEKGEATGSLALTVAKGARFVLAGDSKVSTLVNEGEIDLNGHTLTVLTEEK